MFHLPSTPTSAKLLLLGEAPGVEEIKQQTPFVGPSGNLLRQTLFPSAKLTLNEWHMTNVFQSQLPNNDIKNWTLNKTELKQTRIAIRGAPINKRYLAQGWDEVDLTEAWIESLRPDLIVALGATAQWFLTGDDRIGTFRGSFFQSRFGCPAISTFHPAAALREYSFVPVITMDLIKVREHLAGRLSPPQKRHLYIYPSEEELRHVYARFASTPREPLGVDIETCPSIDQITTIAFATSSLGICIPFWDRHAAPGQENVHETIHEEIRAWRWAQKFCQLPNPKVFQNGMYDLQYMLDAPVPLIVRGQIEDTAIMQHAYQPELRKDLGSLASFYLNEPSWKQMRKSAKDAKADD